MNIIKTLILFTAIVFISSCYKDIDIYNSDDFQSHLVVNAIVGADSIIKVTVLKSAIPGQLDSTIGIDSAIVKVFEDGQYKGTLARADVPVMLDINALPFYYSDFPAREGHIYTIEVEALGQKATAELSFPQKVSTVELSPQQYDYMDTSNIGNGYIDFWADFPLKITINDPAGKNYYMIAIYTKGYGFLVDTLTWQITDSIMSTHIKYGGVYFYDLFNGAQYVSATLPFENQSWRMGTIIFNDELFSEQSFTATPTANIEGTVKKDAQTMTMYYQVITISEDLFNYYTSTNKYNMTEGNPFVEPVNIFSNVQGGIGIVAGYNIYLDSIEIPLTF